MKNFAKLVETSNGNQVLFYVEPDGSDYLLNQIVDLEGVQANFKITFSKGTVEESSAAAYNALDLVTIKHADYVYKNLTDLLSH